MPTLLIVALVYPVMALQFAVTKLGVAAGLNAIDIAGLRYLGALLLGCPLFFLAEVRATVRLHPLRFLVIGLLCGGIYGLLLTVAVTLTPVAHGAVIVPATSITTTMLGVGLVMGIWPDRLSSVGLALIVGGLLVFAGGTEGGAAGALTPVGDLMLLIAGLMWGTVTVLMRRWEAAPVVVAASMLATSVIPIALWLLSQGPGAALAAPWSAAVQMVFQGGLLTVLAFGLWGELVRRLGPTLTILGVACVPPGAMLTAIPILGEWPTPLQYLGAAVVVCGIVLASGALQRLPR